MSSPDSGRTGNPPSRSGLSWPGLPSQGLSWLGLIWVVLFLVAFYQFPLPNNPPLTRPELLQELPGLFLDTTLGTGNRPPTGTAIPLSTAVQQRLPLLLTAGCLWLGMLAAGKLLLRLIWIRTGARSGSQPLRAAMTSLERLVLAGALGASAWSLAVLGLGLCGLLRRELFWTLLAGLAAIELVWSLATAVLPLRRSAHADSLPLPSNETAPANPHATGQPPRRPVILPYSALPWLLAVPFVIVILLGALLPSTDFDVNEYHFGGPKEYFLNGRISFLPHNVYTSFPFLTELLTLSGMVLTGDWYWGALAGKTALSGFGLLTACGLYCAVKRVSTSTAAGWAAWIYLATPWVFRISTIAYVEGALNCFLVLGLLCAGRSLAANRLFQIDLTSAGAATESAARWRKEALRWALLTGLMAGSAMACKYPGLISVVLPLLAALTIGPRLIRSREDSTGQQRLDWGVLFAFGIGVALTIGPWLLKNLVETGNPVYPLAWGIFGGRDWDAVLNARWKGAHSPSNYALSDFLFFIVDVTLRNDWLSGLLYALAPLAFCVFSVRASAKWLGLYLGWLFLSWWLFTHRLDRFWLPMVPLAAGLAGVGLTALWQNGGRWQRLNEPLVGTSGRTATPDRQTWIGRGVALCGVSLCASFQWVFVTSGLAGYNDFLSDLPTARAFAARLRMPEVVFLNERLPAGAGVLCVGDAELFEAQFRVIYNTVFDHSELKPFCTESDSRGEQPGSALRLASGTVIRQRLQAAGITHLYVNWSEILRYRTTYGYDPFITPELFDTLRQNRVLGEPFSPAEAFWPVKELTRSWQTEARKFGERLLRPGTADQELIPLWQVYEVLGE